MRDKKIKFIAVQWAPTKEEFINNAYAAWMKKHGYPNDRKNPHAVALGKKGGRKGGLQRAANMTPEQRKEQARNAVLERWKNKKRDEER